ncbi:capsule assembly Wzi family protein [Ekhidna sp.]|uniref:capsule assembly Wzi family protein n=1 Tax=Ekhidna sp. TaxID=2608089 RepID=UPI0032972EC1
MRLSIIFLLTIAASKLSAQVIFPGYHLNEYYDLLRMKNPELIDPISYHPSIINDYAADSALTWDIWEGKFDLSKKDGDYIEVLNPFAKIGYSSAFPDNYNDGAVWEGKGFNSSLNFGFTGRKGILSFTFAPVVYTSQNKDFYIASSPFTKNPFSYPFERKIDWIVRYGDQSVNKFNLGQSEVRFHYKKVTLGVSTQSMIWGPAQVAPIVMSNNAAGVPHLDIGTAKPIETKIGKIEFKTFWGLMDESDYFDADDTNDQRYLTGAVFGYEPNFIEGLSLGINRVLYRDMFDGDFKPLDLIAAVWGNISNPNLPNDDYDQMMSLMVRWKFKEYGFDSYLEFARNDYPGVIVDFFENPERTRGVTMGFVKTFDLNNGNLIRILFEHTKLNKIKLSAVTTGHPTYYVHSVVENGYTNNGQIMGAYVGPGSNANHVKIQYFTPKGRMAFTIDRVRFNDDYFIANFGGTQTISNDTRFRMGLDYLRFIGNFSLDATINAGYRRNWYYEPGLDTRNLTVSLKIGYLLDQRSN